MIDFVPMSQMKPVKSIWGATTRDVCGFHPIDDLHRIKEFNDHCDQFLIDRGLSTPAYHDTTIQPIHVRESTPQL